MTTSNLVLTRRAYCQLLYWARRIPHEIACFGIALDPDNIFHIDDFEIMPGRATGGYIDLDEHAIAGWLYELGQRGLTNDQALRIYFHTQPGGATPSSQDYKAFYEELLPSTSWMVMGIMGFDGEMSALMGSIVNGCILRRKIEIHVDWETGYPLDEWKKAVTSNIIQVPVVRRVSPKKAAASRQAAAATRDRRRFLRNGDPNPSYVDWDAMTEDEWQQARDEADATTSLSLNLTDPLNQNGVEFMGKVYGPYEFDELNQARQAAATSQDDDDPIKLEYEAAKELTDSQQAATIYAEIGSQMRDAKAITAAAAVPTTPRLKATRMKPKFKDKFRKRRRGRRSQR